jgi:hypothetical protein
MPHVLRTPDGRIDSVHRHPVPGSQPLADDTVELHQWLGDAAAAPDPTFASLDAGLIRVLEDLVDVLVARNIICITDLPGEAQHKLFARKNFRDRFQRNALDLGMGDQGTAGLLHFGEALPAERLVAR